MKSFLVLDEMGIKARLPEADFPDGSGCQLQIYGGTPTYHLANFSRKLRANEKTWVENGYYHSFMRVAIFYS